MRRCELVASSLVARPLVWELVALFMWCSRSCSSWTTAARLDLCSDWLDSVGFCVGHPLWLGFTVQALGSHSLTPQEPLQASATCPYCERRTSRPKSSTLLAGLLGRHFLLNRCGRLESIKTPTRRRLIQWRSRRVIAVRCGYVPLRVEADDFTSTCGLCHTPSRR